MNLREAVTELANLRNQLAIPAAVIAKRSGIPKARMKDIESTRREPTWDELTRYAKALHHKPMVVLTDHRPPLTLNIPSLLSGNTRLTQEPGHTIREIPLNGDSSTRPYTTLITGDVGAGKTWLLARAIDQLHTQANIILADPGSEVFAHLQRFKSPAVQTLQIPIPGGPQPHDTHGALYIGDNATPRALALAGGHTAGFPNTRKPVILAIDHLSESEIQHAQTYLADSPIDGLIVTTPTRPNDTTTKTNADGEIRINLTPPMTPISHATRHLTYLT